MAKKVPFPTKLYVYQVVEHYWNRGPLTRLEMGTDINRMATKTGREVAIYELAKTVRVTRSVDVKIVQKEVGA